jgi:hypothetical protein
MKTQSRQLGHPFQGFQPFWKEHRIRSINRRYGQRREHIAVIVDDGDDFISTLMFVARVANAIAMQDTQIEPMLVSEMSHAGDEGILNGAIIGPAVVNGQKLAVGV